MRHSSILCSVLSICSVYPAFAETPTVVTVNQGQALTESDLLNGEFLGQIFELAPDTIFQINTGGLIGPVGSSTEISPFNFGGSTVNLETGSNFSPFFETTESFLSNITMNAYASSTIWNTNLLGQNAQLNIHGGFYLGKLYDGATINISSGYLLYGTKVNRGSTVIATGGILQGIDLRNGSTLISSNAEITNGFGLFSSSTATLANTSIGIDSWVQFGTLNMTSGSVGDGMFLQASQVVLEDVFVGENLEIWAGNLTLINTSIGDNMHMEFNSNVEMISGSIGDNAYMFDEFGLDAGILTVRGGSIGNNLRMQNQAIVNVYGGTFGNAISVSSSSEMHLFVTAISINGVELDLLMNQTEEITIRDGALLEAILSDGTYFDLLLNDASVFGQDRIYQNALLTATMVPSPSTILILSPLSLFANRRRR